MKLTGYRNLLFAAALSLLPIATTSAHAAGTLTVALEIDDGSWDPIDTFTLTWGRIGSNLYDGLVLRGPDLKLYPGLATSWQFLDDNKRIRFTLRKGVKFHDGEDFNAAAVKFTFDRLLGPEGAKGPQQANYTSIGSVNVVDDYTVDFILKNPDPVLITKLAGYGAMIVPPKYIQEKGDTYFNLHPVGTGPFKFVDYKPKVSLTLEANPDYWGGAPKLGGLVYRFIPEAATQVSELQSGRYRHRNIGANQPDRHDQKRSEAGSGKHHRPRRCHVAFQQRRRHHQGPGRSQGDDRGNRSRCDRRADPAGQWQADRQPAELAVLRL